MNYLPSLNQTLTSAPELVLATRGIVGEPQLSNEARVSLPARRIFRRIAAVNFSVLERRASTAIRERFALQFRLAFFRVRENIGGRSCLRFSLQRDSSSRRGSAVIVSSGAPPSSDRCQ